MRHQVVCQSRGLGIALVTILALIGLFTSMNSHVRSKVPGLIESLFAVRTLKWLLTSVDSHVNLSVNEFRVSYNGLFESPKQSTVVIIVVV